MKYHGFTCPDCGTYHRQVDGTRTRGGEIQIRCPACAHVERLHRVEKAVIA